MTAQERALAILGIALEQRDWRKAEEAQAVLDAAINGKKPWEAPAPFAHPRAAMRAV